ncbi:MAG: CsgG/HfaB family protein, partial [Spirochaetaceae bacterium]
MNRLIGIPLAFVLLVLASCTTAGGSADRDLDGRRGTAGVRAVSIRAEDTRILVRGMERSDIIFDDGYTALEQDAGELELTVEGGEGGERFRVAVPYGTELYVENRNGSVVVAGTRGDVEARLSDTDILVYEAGEYVDIETSNAPILVVKRRGRIDEYSLDTSDAPVHVGIPAGDLNLRLATSNGGFRVNNLPVTVLRRDREELEGFIGSEAGGRLEVESSDGNVAVQPAAVYMRAAAAAHRGAGTGARAGILGDVAAWMAAALEDRDTGAGDTPGADAAVATEPGRVSRQTPQEVTPQAVTPRRSVVFPFREVNAAAGEDGLGSALSEMLVTAVANSPAVTVIERSQVEAVLEESKFQLSGVTSTEDSIEVG